MTTFIGQEGEYQIYNPRFIAQTKLNLEGESVSHRIIHLTCESIENNLDREKINRKLKDIEWSEIEYSIVD